MVRNWPSAFEFVSILVDQLIRDGFGVLRSNRKIVNISRDVLIAVTSSAHPDVILSS